VADEEVGAGEPDVGFGAGAAGGEGFVEGDLAPVVVVGVAGDWSDALGDADGVLGLLLASGVDGSPCSDEFSHVGCPF